MKRVILVLFAVLVVVVVALGVRFAFLIDRPESALENSDESLPVRTTLPSAGDSDGTVPSSTGTPADNARIVTPAEIDEEYIESYGGEVARLAAVGDYTGEGVAVRVVQNGIFALQVQTTLPDPAAGKFYEGWVVNSELTPPFISTGELVPLAGGYVQSFESTDDLSNYSTVVITEETTADGLDNQPEAHVLEGSFGS